MTVRGNDVVIGNHVIAEVVCHDSENEHTARNPPAAFVGILEGE